MAGGFHWRSIESVVLPSTVSRCGGEVAPCVTSSASDEMLRLTTEEGSEEPRKLRHTT